MNLSTAAKSKSRPFETALRRERTLVAGTIVLLIGLGAIYTITGVGMEMSALEMTIKGDMNGMTKLGSARRVRMHATTAAVAPAIPSNRQDWCRLPASSAKSAPAPRRQRRTSCSVSSVSPSAAVTMAISKFTLL